MDQKEHKQICKRLIGNVYDESTWLRFNGLYRKDMSLKEAEVMALATLKQVMEEKITSVNVDIATIGPKYHRYTKEEIEEILTRL